MPPVVASRLVYCWIWVGRSAMALPLPMIFAPPMAKLLPPKDDGTVGAPNRFWLIRST